MAMLPKTLWRLLAAGKQPANPPATRFADNLKP
jgi:hypothetical protein